MTTTEAERELILQREVPFARERVADQRVRFLMADAYDIPPDLGCFNAAYVTPR